MNILGISCFYHDAAACILKDGEIIAAASEERFSRKKHDFEFPENAINYCLREAGVGVGELDYVGFYDKPFLKFERILGTCVAVFPKGVRSFLQAMPIWLKERIWTKNVIQKRLGYKGKVIFGERHFSHAASAFLVSPFKEAAILTVDGVGGWTTVSYAVGKDTEISLTHEVKFPHSLGLLYNAFTYYLGFKVNSDEYKVMGMAPYGKPRYYELIMEKLIDVKEGGSFKLNMKYFAHCCGPRMINKRFCRLFGGPSRIPESDIKQRHFDIASSIQKVTEEVVLKMANHLYDETRLENLCMAGGVALNCVANGRILREAPFKNIFIQPAAGDAGGALGIASFIYHSLLKNKRGWVMDNAYLGPGFSGAEIEDFLKQQKILFKEYPDREELLPDVARLISEGKVIGWFQGRMEFGPRALGNRSILGDARNPDMKALINSKIKFRESFMPFAPSVLAERVSDYFETDYPNPFMLLVSYVRKDKQFIPSVTHVDNSARLQTVDRNTNPLYYDLIDEFYKLTGVPVILNTSFNVRGEPIVCTPRQALDCFRKTDIDYLVMGRFLLAKKRKGVRS